jgi:hypothetical protein
MVVVSVVGLPDDDVRDRFDPVGSCRRDEVVEQRGAPGEALDAEQLLGVERSIRRSMLGMALGRDVAAGDVEHRATGLLA